MYIRRKRQSPKPKECSTALAIDCLDHRVKRLILSFALWRQIRWATYFNCLETIFSMKSQARNDAFRRPDRCETLGYTFAQDSFVFVALILSRRSPRPGLACPLKVLSAITRIILNKSCMRHPSHKDRDNQAYAVRLDEREAFAVPSMISSFLFTDKIGKIRCDLLDQVFLHRRKMRRVPAKQSLPHLACLALDTENV
jgi:hypothetical protein